jgi:hypothetical protein
MLQLLERGGAFDGAAADGFMADSGHIAWTQHHAGGTPLAYVSVTVVGRVRGSALLAEMQRLAEGGGGACVARRVSYQGLHEGEGESEMAPPPFR